MVIFKTKTCITFRLKIKFLLFNLIFRPTQGVFLRIRDSSCLLCCQTKMENPVYHISTFTGIGFSCCSFVFAICGSLLSLITSLILLMVGSFCSYQYNFTGSSNICASSELAAVLITAGVYSIIIAILFFIITCLCYAHRRL